MRAHYLQHVAFEPPGSIVPWLEDAGATLSGTTLYEPDARLPGIADFDFLVVMGGPMSANDESILPWLALEKQLIREAIGGGIPVLGICLGAQLIASAMGAQVYPNREKEIGWFPVTSVHSSPREGVFPFPEAATVFHWHGETFDLPSGAVHLARSAGCENQAFQLGSNVLGLQFHPEMTRDIAEAMVVHSRSELVPSCYVQSEEQILIAEPDRYESMEGLMSDALAFLMGRKSRDRHPISVFKLLGREALPDEKRK